MKENLNTNKDLDQSLITIEGYEVNRDSIDCDSYLEKNKSNKINNIFEDNYTEECENESVSEYTDLRAYSFTKNGVFNKQKIKEICILAFPISLFFSCMFLQQTINLIFIGHSIKDAKEKEDAIDGIGISHIYINCSCISIITGFISGFDTLGACAFGARNYKLLGLYFHRATIISYLIVIFLITIHFFFALDILTAFNVDISTMKYISKYLPCSLIYCFFIVQFTLNYHYLNIIEKSHINLIFLLITLILHPLWCYIFINVLNLGIEGAALTLSVSQIINVIFGCIYIYFVNPLPESIFMYCKQSFNGWWSFLKISIPSAFILCAEWWAWEVLAIIASTLPKKEEFTINIFATNIALNCEVIPIGFGITLTIVVGREFGKGKIKTAENYFKTIAFLAISLNFIISLLIFIFRRTIFETFADEPNLAIKSEGVLALLSVFLIFDLIQNLFTSFLRGIGKLIYATIITFTNFYLFQVGFAIIMTKVFNLGVFGIWLAILIASITSGLINLVVFLRLDLKKELFQTQRRLSNDNKLANEL